VTRWPDGTGGGILGVVPPGQRSGCQMGRHLRPSFSA